jgi:peroxiredoxin
MGCSGDRPQLKNGEAVPEFNLSSLQGPSVSYPEHFAGKVVVIRFWADWCPFCESEMAAIEPVYQQYHDQGLEILAINVRQDRDTAERFIKKLNISYQVALDKEGAVARDYQVLGLPTTYFIDRTGKLHTKVLGESTAEVFENIVKELLLTKP